MAVSVSSTEAQEGQPTSSFWALTLGSIGVVFGDIGTSPLYAFREAVGGAAHGQPVTRIMVLGVLSLILWALFTVVTAKYVLLLLRADNNGEGGTLSLMALGQRAIGRRSWPLLALGVVGASMFIGDSMITPAISVLSAVEGLKLATPHLEHYVVPLTILILVVLFSVQSSGTARVASAFGPVMVVWFASLAVMGLVHIMDDPSVLAAINPYYALQFMLTHGTIGLVTLGAVFLAVTGGEALYADLGHFGRKPIQSGWLFFVLPSLLLNYFGQGALVLSDPSAIENSFYRMVPDVLLLPLVGLATAATVIASQAVITGAYSLISQAVQLGLLPRFEVRYTSETHAGQIYLPRVNRLLLIGVLLLVLLFRTSSGLASAYGIAVSTTMVADGIMGFIVIWKLWNWRVASAAALILPFVIVDMTFFSANLLKLFEGAWVPLLFGRRDGDDDLDLAPRRRHPGRQDPTHRGAAARPDPQSGEAAAAYRQGHRGVPDQRSELRADRVAAQSQAQQGAARAQRDPDHRDRTDAARRSIRARQHGEGERQVHRGAAALRLHGIAERAQGAGGRAQARLAVRHHVDLVLRVAPLAEAVGPVRHAAMAGPPVHRDEPVRQ
ncbi:K+ transporter [Bradyrhizobium sp. USDA 4518]